MDLPTRTRIGLGVAARDLSDAASSAAALDPWLGRHSDPWETPSLARYENFHIEGSE